VRPDEEEPHFIIVVMFIAGYLLEELTASQLLRSIMLDSSGFVVRISLRANLNDPIVIDGVPIGDRAGLSIGFVVDGCLTTA
jgi:hypothetical protein